MLKSKAVRSELNYYILEENEMESCVNTEILITPQPLYNTIVGIHSINRVS